MYFSKSLKFLATITEVKALKLFEKPFTTRLKTFKFKWQANSERFIVVRHNFVSVVAVDRIKTKMGCNTKDKNLDGKQYQR